MSVRFKLAKTGEKAWIYPLPNPQQGKYLIECRHLLEAKVLLSCLHEDYLGTPFSHPQCYVPLGTHTDGSTPLYRINEENFHLPLLSLREKNLEKALKIEGLLSQKILALIMTWPGEDVWPTRQQSELLHRYEKQLQCRECLQLGIAEGKLARFLREISGAIF